MAYLLLISRGDDLPGHRSYALYENLPHCNSKYLMNSALFERKQFRRKAPRRTGAA
jgi:hypothetical protein